MTLSLARLLRIQGFYFVIINIQIGNPYTDCYSVTTKNKLKLSFKYSISYAATFIYTLFQKLTATPASTSRLCRDQYLPIEPQQRILDHLVHFDYPGLVCYLLDSLLYINHS